MPRVYTRVPLAERFWPKVKKTKTCWLWTASKDRKGYGHIQSGGRGGRELLAHRVAYELLKGPIPTGMELDHLCRNPACVNPAHLEPVTHRENCIRGEGIAKKARQTHCKRGHRFDEANTYRPKRGGRDCRICRRDAMREFRERNPEYWRRFSGRGVRDRDARPLQSDPTASSDRRGRSL